MQDIVILGGGFAGIAAAKHLEKSLRKSCRITLIDKHPYHLFTPSLYEVATSEEPRGNIAIPFTEIFEKHIHCLPATVTKIDTKKQLIHVKENNKMQTIHYDFLLLALGSEPAYYNIPGLKAYSVALKNVQDALMIKNKIVTMCCKEGACNKKVKLIIGGGGFSGTELAAEMLSYKDTLAKLHHLDKNCLDITIIQGSDRLLKELDNHVSEIAQKRMQGPSVHFAFGGHITKVTQQSVFTDNNKEYPYDILIWTGGVKANDILEESNLPVNKRGQVMVNNFLQVNGFENIFAAGDNTQYIDTKTNTFAPTVAQVAEEEGKTAGENIIRKIKQKPLLPYSYKHFGYVVPLRGRFAVAELMNNMHFDGLSGWILQQLVFLRYLLSILSLPKAIRRWTTFEENLQQ